MKRNSKATAPTKMTTGILQTWEFFPMFYFQQQLKIFILIKHWLQAFVDVPLNYLIHFFNKKLQKMQLRFYFLKYVYLKKHILNKLKKKFIFLLYKQKLKKKQINFTVKPAKFWRPKILLSTQLGVCSFKWFTTGLHINLPIFFFANRSRSILQKYTKKQEKEIFFLKKSKIQTLRLYFFKNMFERILQDKLRIPISFNFRHLLYAAKKLKRLKSNQTAVFGSAFFYKKDTLFIKSVFLFALGFYYNDSKMIAQQIATRITRSRFHKKTLKQLKYTLHNLRMVSPETIGLQVNIFGKIGAQTRTQFYQINSGYPAKIQTLASRVHYTYLDCYSFTGVFGIHVWLSAAL